MLDSPIGNWNAPNEDKKSDPRLSHGRDTGFFEVMRSLPISIVSIDKGGVITHVFGKNPEMVGLDEMMLGQSIFNAPHISSRVLEAFSQAILGQEVGLVIRDHDNQQDFRLELRPRTDEDENSNGVVCVISQIGKGEKKDTVKLNKENTSSLEQQAIVGLLIRAISHDIQNLLMTVSGYFELAKASDDPQERSDDLEICEAGISRTIEFARQLSQLVCQTPSESRVISMKNILEGSIVTLLQSHARARGVIFTCESEKDLSSVIANDVHIERIIMNLVINAIEASSRGQQIDMSVFNSLCPEREGENFDATASDSYVCIEVRDRGKGIPTEYLTRIFECGFSLKKHETIRGVGLSGVADIVKQLNGHIEVESKEGKGTIFKVYIPAN